MEVNRDHTVFFEIASKYCMSDSFVDHDVYTISDFDALIVSLYSLLFKSEMYLWVF